METTTLKDLLSDNNPYGITGIEIPRIQRAYAQGRSDAHAVKTRERFLSAIKSGLEEDGLTLDFIYGNVNNGKLIPLDGQQRLTTLWLLHWYAARKENVQYDGLAKFTYDTRYSARDFLAKLATFKPDLRKTLSHDITNQGWFPMEWSNDPSVEGMLVMLDEIQARFGIIDDLWNKLDSINFYFRDIEEMKLTDDIYIKMNSRGKPLTDFEHFKAELLKIIRTENNDEETAKRIGLKFDLDWTDLVWPYRDKDNLVDSGLLNFFRMISLILIYKADNSASEYNLQDDFELLDCLYKNQPENVRFLEQTFDVLVSLLKATDGALHAPSISDFFNSYLSQDSFISGKVVVPQQIVGTDLFKAVLEGNALRRNTAYWTVMVYSFLLYLLNQKKVSEEEFRRRIRIVVNLLKNSRNEVVDTPRGDAGNRIPAILIQVESIILRGEIQDKVEINDDSRQTFNAVQMEEERQKLEFTQAHPEYSEGLFELEDYHLIDGRTDVVGFDNVHLYKRFINLFENCSRDAIDCAMLAIHDYSQRLNNWTILLGSGDHGEMGNKAWHLLFHPSGKNPDFQNTKVSLRRLLEREADLDDEKLEKISEEYLAQCRAENRYDWRYYYIAYQGFRPDRFGKYTMFAEEPYGIVAWHTEKRESSNAYQCMLQTLLNEQAFSKSVSWWYIRELTYKKGILTCENDSFASYSLPPDKHLRERFKIPQTQDHIDTVDRIQYFKENRRNNELWTKPEEGEQMGV